MSSASGCELLCSGKIIETGEIKAVSLYSLDDFIRWAVGKTDIQVSVLNPPSEQDVS